LRLEARGQFPRKFNLGGLHAIGFFEAEVLAWVQARGTAPAAAARP